MMKRNRRIKKDEGRVDKGEFLGGANRTPANSRNPGDFNEGCLEFGIS